MDAGWSEFRRMLEYKAEMVRATAHNHRQVLSEHAKSVSPLRGEDRAEGHARPQSQGMDVPDCGTNHDRDLNAAKNILAAGVCG